LPRFHAQSFAQWFRGRAVSAAAEQKVVLFHTCYVNHHDPEIGRASVQVLQKNGVQVTCPEQDCCGMPYFDTGEVDKIVALARRNIAALLPYVDQGYKIVVPMPTCSLMLKKEYPELLGDEPARRVAAATLDLSEYLMQLEAAGRLSKAFKEIQARVLYQVPCHVRDQNIGYKARDLLRLIPGVKVEVVERCSGHDGSFGAKQEYYQISLQIGRKAFDAVEKSQPDRIVSDCPLSALQLEQGTGRPACHPIQLVKEAYDIKP
jgi:Fe-S oxidoreductase